MVMTSWPIQIETRCHSVNSTAFQRHEPWCEVHCDTNGNPAFVQALTNLGWLDSGKKEWLQEKTTWGEIQQKLLGALGSDEEYAMSPDTDDRMLTRKQLSDPVDQGGGELF